MKQQMQNHSFSPSNKNFYLLRFVFCELIKTLNTHTQTHTLWPLPAQGHPRGPSQLKLTPPSHVVGLQSVKLGVSVPTGTGVAPTPASLPLHPGLEAPEGNLGLHPQSSLSQVTSSFPSHVHLVSPSRPSTSDTSSGSSLDSAGQEEFSSTSIVLHSPGAPLQVT